jgi:tetratricopeptide (TPR) repeat protein
MVVCVLSEPEEKGFVVSLVIHCVLVALIVVGVFAVVFHTHDAGARLMAVREILICPISLFRMKDPVTLIPSGHTFDRESLCQWLLINPTRCPFTNVDYGVKLQYGDNIRIRQLLTLYYGDQAYQRYDDATFYIRYEAMWNEDVYENISAYLYGMNSKWIDWTSLQRTLMIDYQEDAVAVGFKSLLLHPDFFVSARLRKNENEALREWERAAQLGLSVLVDAGNPWAQWLKGMYDDIIEEDTEAARLSFQLAANQGLALAQFSLGAICEQDDRDFDQAESFYLEAAAQGHALAHYSIAMLHDEADFHIMRPHLVQAATQGQAEALFYLGTIYVESDIVAQNYEAAKSYFERAEYQGHANARERLDFVLMRLRREAQRRDLRAITRNLT